MEIVINNLLDMPFSDEKYKNERYIEFAKKTFWSMARFSAEEFMDLWGFGFYGFPQELRFIINDDLEGNGKLEYWIAIYTMETSDYEITIRDTGNPKQMEKTIIHELTHLFLLKSFKYDDEHDACFYEFIRRFNRFNRKQLK